MQKVKNNCLQNRLITYQQFIKKKEKNQRKNQKKSIKNQKNLFSN